MRNPITDMNEDKLIKAFLYAPIEVPNKINNNSEFPCHCGSVLKVHESSDSYAKAKCENGHYLAIAWKFVKVESKFTDGYKCEDWT